MVVGFVVNKVTVRQVFLGALRLSVPHIYLPSTPCHFTNWQRY